MKRQPVMLRLRFCFTVVSAFTIFGLMGGEAAAGCFNPPVVGYPAKLGMAGLPTKPAAAPAPATAQSGSIVGLWQSVFTATTPFEGTYDFGFQQFHDDGTELMISGGVPPSIGNVCIGAWSHRAGALIKLRHVTWNWRGGEPAQDLGEAPTGYFLLLVELRVNSRGSAYSGAWRSASYDLDVEMPVEIEQGVAHQLGTFAEGSVRGVRIGVH